MPRILLLTTEPLPVGGMPTTGAGLRAWGLAMGLRAAGLEVRLLAPENAAATFASQPIAEPGVRSADSGEADELDFNPQSTIRNPQSENPQSPDWTGTFARSDLRDAVRAEAPDAVVLQHWGLAAELGEVDCPLAIDLAGPHLLERRLWGSPDPEADLRQKLDALRRADFLVCSGERQRLYFLPYLALAGWDITRPRILPVIPFSMQPAAAPAPPRTDRLIYAGFFLPWQDPALAIETALAALERSHRGELLFIGGAHPTLDVSRGRFEPLLARLRHHPRARMIGPMSFDDYWALLREGGVALDLMERNPERELAFTTRTVVYLAAGLPVIHNDYSEIAPLIRNARAGWTLDPDDPPALDKLLTKILGGEIDLEAPGRAAQRLVAEHLHWDQTIEPLADWCRRPTHRESKTAVRVAFEEQGRRLRELETERDAVRRDLATLRGKRWVRWGLSLASGRTWLRWPLAAAAILIGLALIPVFWINDRLGQLRIADFGLRIKNKGPGSTTRR